jgi:hypothetical protein
MKVDRYRLLGLLVWRGAKWYLRRTYMRRLSALRKAAAVGGAALLLGGALVALARRAQG